MNTSKKYFFSAGTFLIVTLVMIISGCGSQEQEITASSTLSQAVASTTPSSDVSLSSSTITSTYTGAWSTYKDTTYGISFSYPAVFDPAGCALVPIGSSSPSLLILSIGNRINLAVVAATSTPVNYMKEDYFKDTTNFTQEPAQLGGQPAFRITAHDEGMGAYNEAIITKKNNRFYILSFSGRNPEDGCAGVFEPGVYPNIVSSFKFIK